MEFWLEVVWFLLPGGAANLVPPVAAKIFPRWNAPIDLGRTFRGRRLFGAHKTFRGVVSGVLLSSVTLQLQCLASHRWPELRGLEIGQAFCGLWWLGPWLGMAALAGDLVKSFFKRRRDIPSGRSWFPWDQIDWIVGVLVAAYPVFQFGIPFMAGALVLGLILSLAAKAVGYWIGVNSEWI